jgi:hypothetical protein
VPAVAFRGPSAYGVVHLGQQVQADLSGDCTDATTRAQVRFAGHEVTGPPATGCYPVVSMPTEAAAQRAGFEEGQVVDVDLVSGSAVQPLRYWRVQPTQAAAGSPVAVPTVNDPLERLLAMQMAAGDVLDLGRVELSGLQSVDVRNFTGGSGVWELRVSSPTGTVIARGQLGNNDTTSAGDAGWYHSIAPVQLRPAQNVIGSTNTLGDLTPATGSAPHLYLAVVAVAGATSTVINWVDLGGSGVGLPHSFGPEHGFTTIFDGTSFDGWAHVGPGHFVLGDHAMHAEMAPQDQGWAWEWYTREQYSDFVLRLRFKMDHWDDNGGVLMRAGDPEGDPNRATNSGTELQLRQNQENYTGGFNHITDAYRLATGTTGQWNDLEVVAVGPLFVVRVNGVEVQRYHSPRQLRGYLAVKNEQLNVLQGQADPLWSTDVPGNYTISYADIRVHRCLPGDALCAI